MLKKYILKIEVDTCVLPCKINFWFRILLFSTDSNSKPITYIDHFPQPPLNPDFPFNGELQNLLAGKQLLLSDLPFSIDLIQAHYENGYLQYRKSIAIENHQPICIRCGNQEPHLFASFQCASCQEECMYCRNCIMMGKTSTCTPLISWTGPIPVTRHQQSTT